MPRKTNNKKGSKGANKTTKKKESTKEDTESNIEVVDEVIENADDNVENTGDKDSSDISDIGDNDSISDAFKYDIKKAQGSADGDDIDEEAQVEYVQTVVLDRVVKYIKIDDIIKKKQQEHKKEMKSIKDHKDKLEQFLIDYLDKIDQEYIQVGDKGTLTKTETRTKAAPKMEDISVSLIEGFKKYEIYDDDAEIKRVVEDFIETIEEKREVKVRKYLKRSKAANDKDKKGKKDGSAKSKGSNGKGKKKVVKTVKKDN